ncbi:MAG: pyruvate, phosphate dikinase [Actinobacteria bacterium]|nr:MAG: pyruvate, phosphate dikinase [Actinomycetota bacterium]
MSKTKTKYVYDFEEGNAQMKYVLGGKGSNLAEMTVIGLPVPPGFTITTEACNIYSASNQFPPGLENEIDSHLAELEKKMGKKLGDGSDPLLVSVRSGAPFSMPGMMDTVLNLGLNDDSVKGLIKQTGDERFSYDSYRRFIQMFGKVVLRIEGQLFEDAITELKKNKGVKLDTELSAPDLLELVSTFKAIVKKETGKDFPTQPREQLRFSIIAVFSSWNNKRAQDYRKLYKISDSLGTAVNVQTMVFGNKGDTSATGVCFTRNPATGENEIYGDYLTNAQGEDVVAGIRITKPLTDLDNEMPEAYVRLTDAMTILEKHYRDMCDIEFTIEQGKLWMLQTRVGKRTAAAALKIAVDMEKEGLIDKKTAVMRVEPAQLDQLLHPRFDPDARVDVLAKGLNASPGAAVGKAIFDADKAEELGQAGEKVILTRWETTPDDLHGMIAAQGILTSHGGKTSHAAVVARGMGKPCVTGVEALDIDMANRTFNVGNTKVKEGDIISIDGTAGIVVLGEVDLVPPTPTEDFNTVLSWADEYRRLKVRTNADTPEDAAKAREFGAEGIGLARTEHMFLGDRLPIVRKMILADNEDDRNEALNNLLDVQREDFVGIFKAMDSLPVTIRLLDPPLHEFLPNLTDLMVDITRSEFTGVSEEEINEKKKMLHAVEMQHEANPMLGLRGCRLGIMIPELYKMQVRAIVEAACRCKKEGIDPVVEIMIPLVSIVTELQVLREETEQVIHDVLAEQGTDLDYLIGTMIELPRAAVTSDEIAEYADFFSYGTNDLTQTTFGFSRDDIEGKFLARYLDRKILPFNPFETIDPGVAKVLKISVDLGRKAKPKIKLGVCGEHGGDPESVKVFHEAGLDYVSCSPYRVPLARLAAAQSTIAEEVEVSDNR